MTARTFKTEHDVTTPEPSTLAELRSALDSANPQGHPWMIALDIDGTIVDFDGAMTTEMRDTIRALADSDSEVVLATGRSMLGTREIIDRLGLTHGWAVASNGAITLRLDPNLPDGFEVSDKITFDPEPALRALRAEMPEALIAVEDIGRGHKMNAPFPAGELTGPMEIVDFEELCAMPATRVAIRAPEHSLDEFAAAVGRIGLQGVSYAIGWTSWMDINPEGVNKAAALEPVRTRLEIPRGCTVAAGDGSNDLEMLAWAGVSAAMGQGPPPVHAAADLHLESIGRDGLLPLLRLLHKQ